MLSSLSIKRILLIKLFALSRSIENKIAMPAYLSLNFNIKLLLNRPEIFSNFFENTANKTISVFDKSIKGITFRIPLSLRELIFLFIYVY